MDLKMIQSFEIFERFQNIALRKLWSVIFFSLVKIAYPWTV